jgi:putative addiction module killer protein
MYFAQPGRTIVLLLVGGDKTSQRTDIGRAQEYWADYQEAIHRGTSK